MNVEIAEGLVVGPDDLLVVNVKDSETWEDGLMEDFVAGIRRQLGDRFLVLTGADMEIAKVTP